MSAKAHVARRRALARWVARPRWQPDKWERLTLVARLVGDDAESVLDVGGRAREMAWLLQPSRVVSVNVTPPADIVAPHGRPLPLSDASFDVVTSTDVIEHMPAVDRGAHIRELVRVARARVVLCFPVGSTEKDQAELRMRLLLRQELDITLDFLEEHIRFGLPREREVRDLVERAAPGSTVNVWYQNGIEYGVDIVMDGMRAARRKSVGALARFAWRGYARRDLSLTAQPSRDASRLFMVIDL